jgi:predicted translin family RNA/ssDNA-binding protein
MPVLRSILQGFGFTIGARAADEMIEEISRESVPPSSREIDRVRRTRAKAAKKREREVERELSALKKRIRRDDL